MVYDRSIGSRLRIPISVVVRRAILRWCVRVRVSGNPRRMCNAMSGSAPHCTSCPSLQIGGSQNAPTLLQLCLLDITQPHHTIVRGCPNRLTTVQQCIGARNDPRSHCHSLDRGSGRFWTVCDQCDGGSGSVISQTRSDLSTTSQPRSR